jgi:hypothetical protein
LALVEAVTSVLNTANRFHDQRYQKVDNMSVGKKIEKKDARDYNRTLIGRLVLLSDNIPDSDWYALESNNNSKSFFPFSPDAYNNISNSKLVSTLPHDTNIPGKALCSHITSTKGIQPLFTIVGSSNVSSEITNKTREHWLQRIKPGNRARDYKKETELPTILEDYQE